MRIKWYTTLVHRSGALPSSVSSRNLSFQCAIRSQLTQALVTLVRASRASQWEGSFAVHNMLDQKAPARLARRHCLARQSVFGYPLGFEEMNCVTVIQRQSSCRARRSRVSGSQIGLDVVAHARM
jgi:hypothetical protein